MARGIRAGGPPLPSREPDRGGVTAIAAAGGPAAGGHRLRGSPPGRAGYQLAYRNEGLDAKAIAAILTDAPKSRLHPGGHLSGLYLARPPEAHGFQLAVLAILAGLGGLEARRCWRRSLRRNFHLLPAARPAQPARRGRSLVGRGAAPPSRPGRALALGGLARRLGVVRRPDPPGPGAAGAGFDPLRRVAAPDAGSEIRCPPAATRRRFPVRRAAELERLAELEPTDPAFLLFLAQQDRVCAAAYKVADLAHLGAQAEELEIFAERRRARTDPKALITVAAATMAHRVALLPAQLARLPSPEDRALMLGRALGEVLLVIRRGQEPAARPSSAAGWRSNCCAKYLA